MWNYENSGVINMETEKYFSKMIFYYMIVYKWNKKDSKILRRTESLLY